MRAILGNVEDWRSVLRENLIVGLLQGFQGLFRKRSQQWIPDVRVDQTAGNAQILLRLAHHAVKDEMQRF
jgi:hypothetical protein